MTYSIQSVSTQFDQEIQATIDGKTKPLGALGQLEVVAKQLARVQATSTNKVDRLVIKKPQLIVFAGDHGVASEGVSIAPSEVTGQMVANFAQGGAAINVFCRQLGWQLSVVDAGILIAPEKELQVINQRLGTTTAPLHKTQAMPLEKVTQGFAKANQLIKQVKDKGSNLVAFGEMGIGNTTSASAIMAAIMQVCAKDTVGKGTGVTDEVVLKKQQVVEQALVLHKEKLSDPIQVLACLGGFEIVQITGAMLAAAQENMHILVDGFICTAAALVAIQINPTVKDYMIFAHCSGEKGHIKMLEWLEVEPLLNIGLRLGEGTGAALALPLIQASAAFYNEMASFEQADVADVV
ncbi:nicotinate-nucleotide--dimethylbenzimidazole phosphoribosyltransferase [Litorilituus lipolyticus]|uniref:Nicotinate-nucleotide--dimethylbenzimidazole phosphoribosyltransferase n=1 Tax=Litorilituus lipolyticus TaxID=2491017 RepID=A0A502KVU1_9GAMM|nr:nicotinate-nucleotide--dimethylbenzimidazole phosphoribosyltransferase [Litorilituus lipolyticus]TPH15732.1 nicotinate-nucleotide--dimethylbenzimidazole phosphoribosyltransferase [Litorilituus lipolyticus]